MKIFIAISRLIVGSLFIVSGLIKCNDTVGFSYKLNDYFAPDVLGLEFLVPYSLVLAVVICVVEIVLGVAVIFGLKSKLVTTLILLMMLFFTWLTWYTSSCLEAQEIAGKLGEVFNKNCVTDCGCFGDALKLEPRESFYKDLFLLIFTIPLFIFGLKGKIPRNKPKQDILYIVISLLLIFGFGVLFIGWWFTLIFSVVLYLVLYLVKNNVKSEWFSLLIVYIISLAFTWYCLENLPFKDFRAYKIGDNIKQNMIYPEDAKQAVIEYTYVFNVNGKEETHMVTSGYPNVNGDLVRVETKELKKGYEPPITDFLIEDNNGNNLTDDFLAEDNLILVVSYSLETANVEGLKNIKDVTDYAKKQGYTVIGITASGKEAKENAKETYGLDFDFYLCDEKAAKTVVRSNPGILKLEKGTVIQKFHYNDAGELELPEVERSEPVLFDDGTAHLVDGEILGEEESEALLSKDQIKGVYVYKDKSVAKTVLDSINAKTNKNYTSVIKVVTNRKQD